MPLCGFNPIMLKGLTMFAQGLYIQAQKRAHAEGIPLDDAFTAEVYEMNVFLAALDEHYNELREKMDVNEAMRRLVEWTARRKPE